MSALTDDISRRHWRLGVGHPDIDVCMCGWRQGRDNGQIGYNRHLIEVTEAALREQIAAEIEAQPPEYFSATMITKALAAEIARGEA